ncbi:SDR family oxidoreductase [Lentzea sp. NPDC060358]|uniref:SDR family oxidoreductase n=1 Tax=Lentzea sp. NPDC060358 TaxID=3347103 RepID=UPI00366052A6
MLVELDLDGAVVLVTGGVRGVGLGITRAFLSAGAQVLTCARRPAEVPGASFARCDVRDAEQVSALVSGVVDRFGRLDVLVNNAGGAPFALADRASPRFHSKIVELNLLAPLLVAQAANAVMQTQPAGGAIVNVSSISGRRPSPGTAAYGAAKAGLDSLTASLAVEWAPRVRVNALAVGMVRTEQSHLHYGSEAGIEAVARTVPLGRLASPDEVGACAVFLASPLASYVTGATLVVHGGGETPAFLTAAEEGSR